MSSRPGADTRTRPDGGCGQWDAAIRAALAVLHGLRDVPGVGLEQAVEHIAALAPQPEPAHEPGA